MSEIKLIVGLGNPGDKYAETRHNAGEWLIERLARRFNVSLNAENKFFGYVGKTLINGKEVRFLVPTTFMNLSGKAVNYWLSKEKIPVENLLVICDDLNLNFGAIRIKAKGSDGGHNGLKDINAVLNTQQYARFRFGDWLWWGAKSCATKNGLCFNDVGWL